MNNKYTQNRVCENCKFEDERTISSIQASFDETRDWLEPCNKCGNETFTSFSSSFPLLFRESLEEREKNLDLHYMTQDEEIILADEMNLDLIVEFLESPNILDEKRSVLLSALCVILFDNLPDEDGNEEHTNKELALKVKNILMNKIDYFSTLKHFYLDDYIKEIVYPELGIDF